MLDKSNIMGIKINKLTSMLGMQSIWNRLSKPFKPRVVQGRGWPWQIQEKVTNIIKTIETDSITKASHIIKVDIVTGIIKTSKVGTTLEFIEIVVNIKDLICENLRIDTGHMAEVEVGIEMIWMIKEWVEEIGDLAVEVYSILLHFIFTHSSHHFICFHDVYLTSDIWVLLSLHY